MIVEFDWKELDDEPQALHRQSIPGAGSRVPRLCKWANIETRAARTRAVNQMVSEKLVYAGVDGGELTPAGLRAYVDMCERYDAESGCVAYAERAKEAREALGESDEPSAPRGCKRAHITPLQAAAGVMAERYSEMLRKRDMLPEHSPTIAAVMAAIRDEQGVTSNVSRATRRNS